MFVVAKGVYIERFMRNNPTAGATSHVSGGGPDLFSVESLARANELFTGIQKGQQAGILLMPSYGGYSEISFLRWQTLDPHADEDALENADLPTEEVFNQVIREIGSKP